MQQFTNITIRTIAGGFSFLYVPIQFRLAHDHITKLMYYQTYLYYTDTLLYC